VVTLPFAKVGGVQLYYEEKGPTFGEPLVFLNGIFMSTASWHLMAPFFEKSYRVVLHDFRGQWNSEKPEEPYSFHQHAYDLKGLLEHLGLDKVHLVGTSYGGEVGVRFALEFPERVKSLTVISSVSEIRPHLKYVARRWLNAAKTHDPEIFVCEWIGDVYSEEFLQKHREHLWERLVQLYQAFDYDAAVRLLESFLELEKSPLTPELERLSTPTLVLAAEKDLVKPPEYSCIIAQTVPQAQFHIIPDAGHGVVIEKPKETSIVILGFLTSLETTLD